MNAAANPTLPGPDASSRCRVVELRQYTLRPGARDTLIELFDREFVEPQEALGISVIGQFRDLDDPDRFVWLRGFPDMDARARALAAFYGGPVWKAHREAANATMIDSDDVLLLRPARSSTGFPPVVRERRRTGDDTGPRGIVTATICSFAEPVRAEFIARFERTALPLLAESGARVCASFTTEYSVNTFPALPVREGEHVFIWFARFADPAAWQAQADALARSSRWQSTEKTLFAQFADPPRTLRLAPTGRSLLHG
jgi:hypothetical protein